MSMPLADRLRGHVDRVWDTDVLPALVEYVRIPNRSPHFDPAWRTSGAMERAVTLVADWCRPRAIPGLTVDVVRLGDRTPVVLVEVAGRGPGTVLLYGHLDKQPEMEGWAPGLGPWTPVVRGDRLYGRGGADDGYSAFAAVAAIEALAAAGVPYPRCVILVEACEESGSVDLPAYVDHLAPRLGSPGLVVCLDSGCGDYERLWGTTSLRGIVAGTLGVEVLREGVHSGDAGGIVPSSFAVARELLGRLDDAHTGVVRLADLSVAIPPDRIAQAGVAARVLGDAAHTKFPFAAGTRPLVADPVELILNRTWRPALEVIGGEGLPPVASAGNVLRPQTILRLSLRTPPTLDAEAALARVTAVLEAEPPHGARVRFTDGVASNGWAAPPMTPALEASIARASVAQFGAPAVFMGEGGTIPFMAMLGARFPDAQFLITGVLGPGSNAHGPNEFLHLPTAKRLTACVAQVLADRAG